MHSLISATQLCRRFGSRWAYVRIDLQVEPGERLLIFGANGSGKTTLLRTLATVIRPTRGELKIFDQNPLEDSEGIRARLALLSHHHGFYEDLSAPDNLRVLASLCDRSDRSV